MKDNQLSQADTKETSGLLTKVQGYFNDVVAEGHKITWPGKNELFGSTWVVLAFIVILATIILVCDKTIQGALQLIYSLAS